MGRQSCGGRKPVQDRGAELDSCSHAFCRQRAGRLRLDHCTRRGDCFAASFHAPDNYPFG